MDLPHRLYKYTALNQQSIRNLASAEVYFASIKQFNDPLECAFPYSVRDLSPEEARKFVTLLDQFASKSAFDRPRPDIESVPDDRLTKFVKSASIKVIEETFDRARSKGICCLSEDPEIELMWAHYGDGFRGMSLEFSTQHKPFSQAMPVLYSDRKFEADPLLAIQEQSPQTIMWPYLTKWSQWAYEREWRCFHDEASKTYGYGTQALTAVYFGPRADPVDVDIVCSILSTKTGKIKYHQGQVNADNGKLEFKLRHQEYIPYKEAVARGPLKDP